MGERVRTTRRGEEGLLGEVGVQPDVAVVLGLVQAREWVKEHAGWALAIEGVERLAFLDEWWGQLADVVVSDVMDSLNSRTACRASTETSCWTPVRSWWK